MRINHRSSPPKTSIAIMFSMPRRILAEYNLATISLRTSIVSKLAPVEGPCPAPGVGRLDYEHCTVVLITNSAVCSQLAIAIDLA